MKALQAAEQARFVRSVRAGDVEAMEAEIARLRKALEGEKREHRLTCGMLRPTEATLEAMAESLRTGAPVTYEVERPPCGCGADDHNARIDAALRGEDKETP